MNQWIYTILVVDVNRIGGIALLSVPLASSTRWFPPQRKTARSVIMVATKTIEQSVTFNASPHDVYEALMDSEKHSQFTGAKALISREVGDLSLLMTAL